MVLVQLPKEIAEHVGLLKFPNPDWGLLDLSWDSKSIGCLRLLFRTFSSPALQGIIVHIAD